MRILVTGGAWFIGCIWWIVSFRRDNEVVVLDNLATGLRGNVPGPARFLWGDVSRLDDVERAFEGGLDAVFHIAARYH
jgi:UDP-glucose 4-epimerase